jgi:hypothetical protein
VIDDRMVRGDVTEAAESGGRRPRVEVGLARFQIMGRHSFGMWEHLRQS